MIKIIDTNISNDKNNDNIDDNNTMNQNSLYQVGYPIVEKDSFYNNAAPSQVNKFNNAMKNLNDFLELKGLFMYSEVNKLWGATNERFHRTIMNFLNNHTNIKKHRFWNDLDENQKLCLCRSVTYHEGNDDNDHLKFNINFDDKVAQVGVVFNGSVTITANLHPDVKKCKIGQCFGAIEKFNKLFYKEGEGEDPYNPKPKQIIKEEDKNDITIIKELPLVETVSMEGRGALLVFHISSVRKAMETNKSLYKKKNIKKKNVKFSDNNDNDDNESIEFEADEIENPIPEHERIAKSDPIGDESFSDKLAALADDDGQPLTVTAIKEMADFEIPEHYVITEADAYCIRVRKLSRKTISGVLYEYLHASEMLPKLHEDISSKYIQNGNAGRQTLITKDSQLVYIVIKGCIKVQIERIVKNSGSIAIKKKGEKALHIKTKTMPLLQLENGGILSLDDECFTIGQVNEEINTGLLLSKSLTKLPKASKKKVKVEDLYNLHLCFEQPTSYLTIPIKKFKKALVDVPRVTAKRITDQLDASTENIKQRIKNLIPWITGSTALSLNHNNIIFNDDTNVSYDKKKNLYGKDTLVTKGIERLHNKDNHFDIALDVIGGMSKDYSQTLNDEIKSVIEKSKSKSQEITLNQMYPLVRKKEIKYDDEN